MDQQVRNISNKSSYAILGPNRTPGSIWICSQASIAGRLSD